MIKNLLFDLGGVIMDIDRMNCIRAFKAIGMNDIDQFLGDYCQKGIFADLEEGRITPEQFRAELKTHCPEGTTDARIDEAFNDFLLGIPVFRLEMLLELKEEYKIYLLSNTNAIMWHTAIAEAFRQIPGLDINSYFDGIVTSFEAHSLKPDEGIFRYAEKKLGIKPEETLFLDDSEANVEAARRLGFKSEVVPSGTDIFTCIFNLIARCDAK